MAHIAGPNADAAGSRRPRMDVLLRGADCGHGASAAGRWAYGHHVGRAAKAAEKRAPAGSGGYSSGGLLATAVPEPAPDFGQRRWAGATARELVVGFQSYLFKGSVRWWHR